MSGFSIDWLDLREDADRRARDRSLQEQAIQWLEIAPHPIVVDLGAGTGSTLRALTGTRPEVLTWRLVDHDSRLLAEAGRRHGDRHRIETCAMDLARIGALPLNNARLVTASALFDLVSADFLEGLTQALLEQCRQTPVGVYAALNYDGVTDWTPAHPMDEAILAAFNRDQRRDKGFGPALGPDACAHMQQMFTAAGFTVHTASTPWVLDGSDHRLASELIRGAAATVAQYPDIDTASLQDWTRFRQRHVTTGTCTVGHTDLLALPGRGSADPSGPSFSTRRA